MKIWVLKTDGSTEPYLHTKVMAAFHNALCAIHESSLSAAEELAEAVTFHLYHNHSVHSTTVSSDEIYLLIKSVLCSTGFAAAAEALSQHRMQRKIQRKRLVVLAEESPILDDCAMAAWDKAKIVQGLMQNKGMDRLIARAIAASVEEKIFRMGMSRISRSLIHELVQQDTRDILDAQKQLLTATG